MNKLILGLSLFLSFSHFTNAKVVCTQDNLVGDWSVKYILSSSAAVGSCNIKFDNNLVPSGTCDNFADSEGLNIFDGIGSITKSCNVKSKILFENGSKMSTVTKMAADKQYMTGTFSESTGIKLRKGKITFQKTGSSSCNQE